MPEAQDIQESHIKVVTSENFEQYVNEQLGDPEAQAKVEHEALQSEIKAKEEAQKEEDDPVSTLDEHVPKEKKNRLQERFSKLTGERKAAEERATQAQQELAKIREEAVEAKRIADELKNKYEPVKVLDKEPEPSDFTDIGEYAKALKDYTTEKTLKDQAAKEAQSKANEVKKRLADDWTAKASKFEAENPDYKEVIEKAADIKVSDQVMFAILDSDIGPKLQYHLAQNPDVAVKIGEMTLAKALKEIGKLEVELSKEVKAVSEISKAPPPISPLKGGASISSMKGTDDVPGSMTYEEWKAARQSGRIK